MRAQPLRHLALLVALAAAGCPDRSAPSPLPSIKHQASTSLRASPTTHMVAEQLVARGIRDPRVLAAMRKIARHRFVPPSRRDRAYEDRPLSIGHHQTISQPYIVGFMSEALRVRPQSRVLEIGTGSGYQTAVLAELAKEVYTIEIVEALGLRANALLTKLGYDTVRTRIGDGYAGWPSASPFDRIILTAAPPKVPTPLLEQLAMGGILVAPIGERGQYIVRWTKTPRGLVKERLIAVRFVPMTGEAQKK